MDNDFTQMELITDAEFSLYSLNNTSKRLEQIASEIIDESRIPTVYVWNDLILDGHKQYDVCRQLNIPYKMICPPIKNRADALLWIVKHILSEQLYYKKQAITYCIGAYYNFERNMIGLSGHNQFTPEEYLFDKKDPSTAYSSAYRIGEETGVQFTTVRKYSRLSKNMDIIAESSTMIFKAYLEGTIILTYDVIRDLSLLSKNELLKTESYISTVKDPHISMEEVYKYLHKRQPRARIRKKEPTLKMESAPMIKTMPTYNADSALSSLILTIPSWISSIERTQNTADFENVTKDAKEKLATQLINLNNAIIKIYDRMELKNQ